MNKNIIQKQPTKNIGVVGHVSHGKSTIVKLLTGINTMKNSSEKERNITINMGYANAKVFKCSKCSTITTDKSNIDSLECSNCNIDMDLIDHWSFVDCPGHDAYMSTMINGASVMDIVLLVISSNDDCPQPQTVEHLMACQIMNIQDIIVCHNKLDLLTKEEAIKHKQSLDIFLSNTKIKKTIPISANSGININYLLDELSKIEINRHLDAQTNELRMSIVRTFKTCNPGSNAYQLKGGILGGSIIRGKAQKNQIVEIRPGKITKKNGIIEVTPIYTTIIDLRSEDNQLDEAYPGGLIGIMTTLDPQYTMSNKLVGHILGEPGTLPPVYSHIEIDFNPIERYQHLLPGLKEFKNIELEIHCLCMETKAKVLEINKKKHTFYLELDIPITADINQTLSILYKNRLVAIGKILSGDKIKVIHTLKRNELDSLPQINTKTKIKNTLITKKEIDIEKNIYDIDDNCRMLPNKLPEIDELVCAKAIDYNIDSGIIRFELLEYNNIPAFSLLSNMTKKKRIKSYKSIVNVGKNHIMNVFNLDNTNMIELSKFDVIEDDIKTNENIYIERKYVHNLFTYCAKRNNINLIDIYELFGWILLKDYTSIKEGLLDLLYYPEKQKNYLTSLNEKIIDFVFSDLRKKININYAVGKTQIKLSSETFQGIIDIQLSLIEGESMSDNENQVDILLDSPPYYNITIKSNTRNKLTDKIWTILNKIEETILYRNGYFEIVSYPKLSNDDIFSPNKLIEKPLYIKDIQIHIKIDEMPSSTNIENYNSNNSIDNGEDINSENSIDDGENTNIGKNTNILEYSNNINYETINNSLIEPIHIYLAKRKSRKHMTKITNIQSNNILDISKQIRKDLSCSATVMDDDKLGKIIQIQGNFCEKIVSFLTTNNIVTIENIKLHGFYIDMNTNELDDQYDNTSNTNNLVTNTKTLIQQEYLEMLDIFYQKYDDTIEKKTIKIPPPKIEIDRKNTKIVNFYKICKEINRITKNCYHIKHDDIYKQVIKYFEIELSTNSSFTDDFMGIILTNRFKEEFIENVIRKYCNEYVKCLSCNSYYTQITKENKLFKIECLNTNCKHFRYKNIL